MGCTARISTNGARSGSSRLRCTAGWGAASGSDIDALRAIAKAVDAELWMAAVTHRAAEVDADGVPEPVAHLAGKIDVILRMAHDTKAVHVSLLKDHDNPDVSDLQLALDPTTMLLVREH